MGNQRPVTERDLRWPKYGDGDPSEFEFLPDGSIVRRDRWERGIRMIHGLVGMDPRQPFEVAHVVQAVKELKVAAELGRRMRAKAGDAVASGGYAVGVGGEVASGGYAVGVGGEVAATYAFGVSGDTRLEGGK